VIPQRVVSLVPSLTETLFDLGCGDAVVGVTDFCIFPPDLDRPRVGGTKNPKVDAIRALQPDLVHMNMEENLRRHADEIATFARVFVTEPKSIDDVASLIVTLGELHDANDRAAELVRTLDEARFTTTPFTFAVPIWKKQWMWCGGDTYVSALVESCGGRNVLRDRERYPSIEVAEVVAMKPDIIFLPDEPYAFTEDDAQSIDANVIGPFPGHLFTWHGTRTIEGLRFLRRVLR
jgi:ABC-type Fe3+-hydroxamate transport system substrate-binding protein